MTEAALDDTPQAIPPSTCEALLDKPPFGDDLQTPCGSKPASKASIWDWCGIREEDARKQDPEIVENGIGDAIRRESHPAMARSICLVLYRGTFYYGKGGHGLKQIRDKAVSNMDMHQLMYALYKENKQTGERAHMGDGWEIRADLSATILRQIHGVLFIEPIFDPLWWKKDAGEAPLLSYDTASPENIEALFPPGNGCVLCLQSHEMTECQRREAGSVPICPKPIGQYRRDSHSDIISMLLAGKYGSFTTLTKPTIQAWVQFFRPETTTVEFLGHLHKHCELSGRGPKGDLWALRKEGKRTLR